MSGGPARDDCCRPVLVRLVDQQEAHFYTTEDGEEEDGQDERELD